MFEPIFDFQGFKIFLQDNKIIGTVIAVIVAYSAWDLIQSFVGDIILPTIYFLLFHRINTKYTSIIFEPMNKLNIPKFIKEFLSFIVVLFLTFTLIYQGVNNKILDNTKNNNNKNNDNNNNNFLMK
jgi:large-conductance mechanosensitive channel